jgi:hypothetical protein
MGHDPQLDLRVVRRKQDVIGIRRNERPADLAAKVRSNRDVLKIRIDRRQRPVMAFV